MVAEPYPVHTQVLHCYSSPFMCMANIWRIIRLSYALCICRSSIHIFWFLTCGKCRTRRTIGVLWIDLRQKNYWKTSPKGHFSCAIVHKATIYSRYERRIIPWFRLILYTVLVFLFTVMYKCICRWVSVVTVELCMLVLNSWITNLALIHLILGYTRRSLWPVSVCCRTNAFFNVHMN